jgi:NADH-quinone oxidoreductase subunit M
MSLMLPTILGLPLAGAIAVALVPRNYRFIIRSIAQVVTLLSMLTAFCMFWHFIPGKEGYQFVANYEWVKSLGISLKLGVDGLNVGLVLMGTIVAFAATSMSYMIKEREKEYYLLLLVMITGILGAFASLDIFFFFFFHELALIPTFIMIGVWGRGENKNYATFNITLYLTLGALIALVGLVALYVQTGAKTFDIEAITAHVKSNPIPVNAQHWIFPLLLFGFGILVSLWPFHTWAPLGYGAAPTATAMLHAGVLKKFGLYGLLRIALPLMPEAARSWAHVIAFLCLGNIFYVGLVAMRQRQLNLLIGNSSVAHMGLIFLGIASLTVVGVTGAVVIMIAHGLLAALSFAINGHLYHQTQTENMDQMGGLMKRMPFIGAVVVGTMMAGCGLPGFANFVGEAMTLFAAWRDFHAATAIAVWGALVIGAVYMLRAIRNIVHGPMPEHWERVRDADGPLRKLPFVLLGGTLLVFGCFPGLLTEKIKGSAAAIVQSAKPSRPVVAIALGGAPSGTGEAPVLSGKK